MEEDQTRHKEDPTFTDRGIRTCFRHRISRSPNHSQPSMYCNGSPCERLSAYCCTICRHSAADFEEEECLACSRIHRSSDRAEGKSRHTGSSCASNGSIADAIRSRAGETRGMRRGQQSIHVKQNRCEVANDDHLVFVGCRRKSTLVSVRSSVKLSTDHTHGPTRKRSSESNRAPPFTANNSFQLLSTPSLQPVQRSQDAQEVCTKPYDVIWRWH